MSSLSQLCLEQMGLLSALGLPDGEPQNVAYTGRHRKGRRRSGLPGVNWDKAE